MIRFFQYLLLLSFFTFKLQAQSISISTVNGESGNNLCVGQRIVIQYKIQDTFNADNKFTVQVKKSYDYSGKWNDVETKDSSGFLIAILPQSLFNNISFAWSSVYIDLRIASSSPAYTSAVTSSFTVYSAPIIDFNSIQKQVLSPYESVAIGLGIVGTTPMEVLMSDSSRFTINNYSENSKNNLSYVNPSKTGIYSILKVSNLCGIGTAKGSFEITVIDKRLEVTGVSTNHVCKNGKLEVYYLASGNWVAGDKFHIRLISDNSYLTNPPVYDVESEITSKGILTAKIVDTIPKGSYNVQIVSDDAPVVVSNYYRNRISVHPESKVELTTESNSINYGERKGLTYTVSGYGTYSIEFNTGEVLNETNVEDWGKEATIFVTPKVTTDYKIKSFSSSVCGIGSGTNTVKISVNKGIKTDSLKAGKYCEGSTCEVAFSSSEPITIGSTLIVKMFNQEYGPLYGAASLNVIGTVTKQNTVSFMIPYNLSQDFFSPNFYVGIFTYELPDFTVSPNYFTVLAEPTAKISFPYLVNLSKPQDEKIDFTLGGGGLYTLELSDNSKYFIKNSDIYWNIQTPISVYFAKSTDLAIRSVSNECGVNTDVSTITKTVTVQDTDYALQVMSKNLQSAEVCAGSKLDINLISASNFGAGNQFTIELISNEYYIPTVSLGAVPLGKSQINIPANTSTGVYYIRISSSNPLYYSNKYMINVRNFPEISLSTNLTTPILAGEIPYIYAQLSGGGTNEVEYKDGTKVNYELGDYSNSFTISKVLNQTTTFGVKSIKNICGVGKITSSDFTISVVNYKIENKLNSSYDNYSSNGHCQNHKITVPFEVIGKMNVEKSFSIQMAKNGSSAFTTILSGVKQSPALISIPDSYKDASCLIRIVSSDNLTVSEAKGIALIRLPDVTLKLNNGKSEAAINAGESIALTADMVGSSQTKYVILENNTIKTFGDFSYGTLYEVKNPTQNTVYTLISASNECGVGKASGSVTIKTIPVLSMIVGNNYANSYCIGRSTDVTLNSLGTFYEENVFKVSLIDVNNTKTTVLSTSKNGKFTLSFANQFKPGNYKIQLESSSPYQVKDYSSILLTEPVEATISGNPIVNLWSGAYIILKDTKSTGNKYQELVSFELDNGSKGSVYLNAPSGLNTIFVAPLSTTTYTLKSVENACGVGKASGSATVTVNLPTDKQLNITNPYYSTKLCVGSTFDFYFETKGNFSAQNKFKVQISDNTGRNYKDLGSEGNTSPLKVKIPNDLPLDFGYYFRIVATDKDYTSTSTVLPHTITEGITARFDSASYFFNQNSPVTINLTFTGTPPFTFYIGADELSAKMYSANANNYGITLNPVANTAYRLFSVSNSTCGTGTILSPSTVRIELVTALEELGKLGISVFPNPTADVIQIESKDKELSIQLIDFSGKIVQEQVLRGDQKQVDISKNASGTYFLRVLKETKEATFKIIKL